MRGRIVSQGEGKKRRHYIVVNFENHPAQRCIDCNSRLWVEVSRARSCPKCGGVLEDTRERRQKWLGDEGGGGFRTKTAARDELPRLLARLDGDSFPERLLLSDYVPRWLEHKRSRGRRARTLARYEQLLVGDVLPILGDLELRKIRPAHVQDVLDRMHARGLSPRTVVQARAVLGGALRQAVAWGLIPYNPVTAVEPPKVSKPRLKVPTPLQVAAVIEGSKSTEWEIPILLAGTLGTRRSETLAVAWENVDLDGALVRITRSLQRTGKGRPLEFLDLKSERGRRTISLPGPVVARLRLHRKEQAERRLLLGTEWHDLDLVCEGGDGAPLSPDQFTKAFKRLAARAGLDPATRLHDVRHAFATELGRRKVHPVIVSALVGHSTPAFTMAVYQHAWEEGSTEAASVIGASLGLE
jgi:integrase